MNTNKLAINWKNFVRVQVCFYNTALKLTKLKVQCIGKTWKFCWTNFDKIRRFLCNQDEFGSNCSVDKHSKISVDNWTFILASCQKSAIISVGS